MATVRSNRGIRLNRGVQNNQKIFKMKNIGIAFIVMFLAIGCSSQKTNTNAERQAPRQGERTGPPSTEEIFEMDANNDGKLSKSEVKGPLQRDFSRIDSNSDGFITMTELENAPKPQRGQRPPRN